MTKKTVAVYNLGGASSGRTRLPKIFNTPIRPDVVRRAVLALQSHRFQPKGRDVMAGKRRSTRSWGTGHSMSRVPRVKTTGRAAFAPGTVGGRQAHPPKVEKKISKKINKKERHLAIRAAVAATINKNVVASRGHVVDGVKNFPLVVKDTVQDLKTVKDVVELFKRLGVWSDVLRVARSRKVRAGKGKLRGRKIKQAVGPLIVIAEDRGIQKAARNLPGVDVVRVDKLNAELLAPGTHCGRLTIWSESAFKHLDETFM